MLAKLRKKQKWVRICTLVGTLAICIAFTINMIIWHREIVNYEPPLCEGKTFMNSTVYNSLYRVYFAERITASLLINFWLIWQTCKVMTLLQSETDKSNRSFKQEKRRINFIYWSFVISYISYCIADMIQVIYGIVREDNNILPYTEQELDLVFFLAFMYIPIFTVLYTHLMNYSSVRSILKMVWKQDKSIVQTDGGPEERLILQH